MRIELVMEKPKLSRKERDYLRHKREIMEVALSLFSKKGFNNVSMHEIAQKAEFAVGTLYKFFPHKEDLYGEILKEKILELRQILFDALSVTGSEIKQIRSYVRKKTQWFKDNMEYIRLHVTETMGVGFIANEDLKKIIKEFHHELIDKLVRLFKSGIEKKTFKNQDPYMLAMSLNGISNSLLFEVFGYEEEQQYDADAILDIFLRPVRLEGADENA
jgi:TetR/AcrR family transcriptional regulator